MKANDASQSARPIVRLRLGAMILLGLSGVASAGFVPIQIDDVTIVVPIPTSAPPPPPPPPPPPASPPIATPNAIPALPPLSWMDVVTKSFQLQGGASKTQYIFEVDVAKLPRVQVGKDDPFWFKYYVSMWNNSRTGFLNNGRIWGPGSCTANPPASSIYNVHYSSSGFPDADGTKYATRSCHSAWKKALTACGDYVGYHYRDNIGSHVPTYWGYGIQGGLSVGMLFKINLNEYTRLAAETSSCYEAGMWREVRAGEVTPDGWAIVPQKNDINQLQWYFVQPKGKRIDHVAACEPGVLGCNESLVNGGLVTVFDPPLFTMSDAELVELALQEGAALGFGDSISAADVAAEGFYVVSQQPDGSWAYSNKLDLATGSAYAMECGCAAINGSGNNFTNGMSSITEQLREGGKAWGVAYYMPQKTTPGSYAAAQNSDLRTAINRIASDALSRGIIVNISTHSWSGFVTSTACSSASSGNHCQNVNHVSFAPATIPGRYSEMANGLGTYRGTGTMLVGSGDRLLSGMTLASSLPYNIVNGTSGISITSVGGAGHPIRELIDAGDFRSKWK